jgi:sigma-B regulation protein RsbU (phosphoserine phosphatase)
MMQTIQKKRGILFVDDEQNILNALKRELHEWARENTYELKTAISAREALKHLAEEAANTVLVVSDLKMPEMLGSDFLLEVKRLYPGIITILLTGYSEAQELMKAVRAGIFSYILKPWDPEYLRIEIEKAIEAKKLRDESESRARIVEEELRWAGEMQRALLKPRLLSSEGVEFRTSYRPVTGLYCGGDYYDVVDMGPSRYLVLLGDVAGHGIRAAFVTGILKAVIYPEYLQAARGKSFSPAAFLSWLNERMNFELRKNSGIIITFFAGYIDLQSMKLTYANAGHTHPYSVGGSEIRELPASGTGLGFASSVSYIDRVESIAPGDVLVAYTDGLVECRTPNGGCIEINARSIVSEVPYGADYHKRLLEKALSLGKCDDFDDDVTILTARIT